jgi:hypothetical protein
MAPHFIIEVSPMAFILTKKRVVEWPVTLAMPVDGGNTQDQLCTAHFDIITQDEYNKLVNDDIAFLKRVVVGFGPDVQNEDGSPMACTDANKHTLFSAAGFIRLGFINGYHEASSGIAAKNSKGSVATGRPARKSPRKK